MTHKEIARQLGISPASLSIIINNKTGVSEKTRTRILHELNKLGYAHLIKTPKIDQAHEEGAGMLLNKTICFVAYRRNSVVVGHHPFFMLLMESIENRAKKYGYLVQFMTMNREDSDPAEQIKQLNRIKPDGVIVMSTEMQEDDLAYFDALEIPVVFIDNDFFNHNVHCVSIHNQMGTFQAIEYLVKMGHTDIGILHDSCNVSSWEEREAGYRYAIHHFGLTINEDHCFQVPHNEHSSYQVFREYLKKDLSLPTAFVSDDDVMASGVMRAFTEYGYRIPEDISFVGFNDRPLAMETEPPLTSINVPKYSYGSESVDTLVALINNLQDPLHHCRAVKRRISTELIVRDSVRKL
ncbi:MAG: LacI family DNA-binding transcriptional regulator [Eubacteriales bacterium]|nr:LacI family DNA-binding transcriptional regulator [Eubacteriales bacterium]